MPIRLKYWLSATIMFLGFFTILAITSHAESVSYFFDDLGRLERVVYDNHTVIQYTYDGAGNRLQEIIRIDSTPPAGSIVINSDAAFTNSSTASLRTRTPFPTLTAARRPEAM